MIYLTIGENKIKALIDTGSTTSIMNETKLPKFKRIPLSKKTSFTSLNGSMEITHEIITDLPIEFSEKATMSWKLTNFLIRILMRF